MDIKVNGRTLSDRPLVLGVQGDNNVEELRFLVPRYTDAGVDLSLGIGYAVFRLPDGTDGHVSLTPEVLDTDENTVSLTLLVGSQMTEQKGSGKLCLKVAGLESAMWSSAICDMFVNGTIAMPSPQPYSLFRTMSVGPRLAEEESEPPLTVTERTINIPAELQTIAVAQDENSETVKIVVPRYFDGQDLSVHDFILHTEMGSNGTDDILFNNQNGQMKAVEDSTVTLTWVLRPPQTSFEGKLNIQLLVQGEEFKWHSLIGELTIAKHITGDPVVPATPSMYEQWLAEVKEQADYVRSQAANIQQVVDNLTDIQNAAENAQAAAASAAAAQQAAQEALGFRTFFSAVRPDKNGNLDPSRPMTVGPAASVEIESAGDRIQSVTALGFTRQAGTGDPSPSNVRAITNVGLKLVTLVLNGTEGWTLNPHSGTAASGSRRFQLAMSVTSSNTSAYAVAVAYCSHFDSTTPANTYGSNYDNTFSVQNADLQLRVAGISTVGGLKRFLAARYAAGDPVIVWCQPADESQATGLYAPIILTSGEYRATCLPLTAPLCEGDSVVSWAENGDGDAEGVETHVQSVVVADGSTTALTQGSGGYTLALPGAANGAVKCDTFNNLTAASGSVTIPTSQFPPSVTSLETANQWLQSNNVTVVYPLATPAVYTHDPVALEAATGDQLTYTVTGQSGGQVSVAIKPFQDGGHAKTTDSATTAQNATQFDGHAWSEVPGQAPVQSVNSKTGAVTLGAADVGAVPLAHTAVLADGIALKDGSPVNTPADIDQYTVLRIYSNYGAAVCSVPIKGGQTGFLPFINGTSAPNINIVVVNISRTETQLTLETNAALRLATTGITAPGTALSVYRIEGLV